MEKRHLHLKGPVLSRVVAGCWRWNSSTDVETLARTALDCGITSFDHADVYGDYDNQKLFGAFLKKNAGLRAQMQLVSKCGLVLKSARNPDVWIKHYNTTKEHILQSVDRSLADLGTEYLDLLLIHRPDPLMDPDDVSEAFGLLRQNGKVLHFGVSNFSPTQFEMLQQHLPFPLVTNQVPLSLNRLDVLYNGTLDVLMKNETGAMIYSPLGGGKVFAGGTPEEMWKKKAAYNCSDMQLALAWLLNHPGNLFPVIGTTQPARLQESAKAAEVILGRQDWFEMLRTASGANVPS